MYRCTCSLFQWCNCFNVNLLGNTLCAKCFSGNYHYYASLMSLISTLRFSDNLSTSSWKTNISLSYIINTTSVFNQAACIQKHRQPGNCPLQWHHNERDGVSYHQPHDCLLNGLFKNRSKKTPKLCVTGICAGNSPVTGEFPAQRASNAESVSIWWRPHDIVLLKGWHILLSFCCHKTPYSPVQKYLRLIVNTFFI